MKKHNFFPEIFSAPQELDREKLVLLASRGIAGLSLSGICTILMLALLYINNILTNPIILATLVLLVLFAYPQPILLLKKQLDRSNEPDSYRKNLHNYFFFMLAVVMVWNAIAISILPMLPEDTRIIIICLYIATVYANFLPLALFPKYALLLVIVNMLPMATRLALLGDPHITPLGLAGLVLIAKEILVISWIHHLFLSREKWDRSYSQPVEPDMSYQGLQQPKVAANFVTGLHAVVMHIALAFFLVIALRESGNEQSLWSWFLLLISLQTLRSASHVKYLSNPNHFTINQWRIISTANIVISQAGWLVFMFIFYFQQRLISTEAAIALQIAIAVISVIGLSSDRWLLYCNTLCCLVFPFIVAFNEFNPWMAIALAVLTILTLGVGLENLHNLTLRSLESLRLRQLAEYRAAQMQSLNDEMQLMNTDLTFARKRLIETNTSLEAQVQQRTRELQYQAEHDMLTGLGNRYRFTSVVEEALLEFAHNKTEFAVYMLDLNRFKEINDGLGHSAGDKVLQETAHRLRASCVPGLVCARWGGDEFVILQNAIQSQNAIMDFSENLLSRLSKPIELESGPVMIGASIGVAICPNHGITAQQLIEHADIAVYRAKCDDQSLAIYEAHWGTQAAARLQMAQSLRTAIANEELDVALQPFIAASNGGLTGFEALARWPLPDGKMINPVEFIPVAEECGLMPALGLCILRKACHTLYTIAPDSQIRIAVNISVSQLLTPGFHQDVIAVLAESGLPASRLELEITENLFAADIEQIRTVLSQLRTSGIRIAIDDFGTGYSSISYLRNFPIDSLKIDRSFVTALNNGGEAIYASIISLAKSLQLHTIVEGVETEKELKSVMELGGQEIQGYYFAKPMQHADLIQWLEQHKTVSFKLPYPKFFIKSI